MEVFKDEVAKIWAQRWKSGPYQRLFKIKDSLGDQKLVFYGAGRLAKVFWDICVELDIPVAEIWDKNVQGTFQPAGLPIIPPPPQISPELSNVVILICSHAFNQEIQNDLRSKGFDDRHIIPCIVQNACYGITEENLKGYEWSYNFFSDVLSKQLVLDKCALQMLDKNLSPNTQAECYYEDCFTFGLDEVFVDGGAYIGDSAERFVQKLNGAYKHIYAFEPDLKNLEKAKETLKTFDNITLIPSGLWSSSGQMNFSHHDQSSGSSIFYSSVGYESYNISVVSLDKLFLERPLSDYPTFIKMDIEGSEKEALLGGKNIILKKKPKLAICAYHKAEDIYELPQIILSIREDYQMILRQHSCGSFDTVLYAF